ncbi:MAG: polysaccharide deacetylase family protein [Planctomycetes bacterium]|nr:polysaccharide deacetylase family protein [Planctomycetota bacterium]
MFGRLFDKFKKRPDGEPGESLELTVDRPTIGLCFNFERGLLYESEYLFDVGMQLILKTLKDYKLRATFNCPAKLCDVAPDQLKMIAQAGHEIAVLGFGDESPKELTDEAVRQLVFSCRSAFARRGLHPIGFRSPHSKWDMRLCRALARQNFRYNAEHDHAKHPYVIIKGPPSVVRLPTYTDDRGLRRSGDTQDSVISKHLRVLRKAIVKKHFASIVFHPWILAEDMERMDHWQGWVRAAVKEGAQVGAMEDLLPAEYR